MQCPKCNYNATIAKTEFKSEVDTTDVFAEQTMVCVNSQCDMYAGTDLSNPVNVIEVIRNQVN